MGGTYKGEEGSIDELCAARSGDGRWRRVQLVGEVVGPGGVAAVSFSLLTEWVDAPVSSVEPSS